MNSIEALTNERIGKFLKNHGLRWLRTDEGDFIVDMSTEFGKVRLILANEGDSDDRILLTRVTSDVSFGPDYWPTVMALVNTWNRKYRFSKAFLAHLDEQTAVVVAEFDAPVGAGLTDELLDLIAGSALDACVGVHRFVLQQLKAAEGAADAEDTGEELPSADDLESWLHRSA